MGTTVKPVVILQVSALSELHTTKNPGPLKGGFK